MSQMIHMIEIEKIDVLYSQLVDIDTPFVPQFYCLIYIIKRKALISFLVDYKKIACYYNN